MMSGKIFVPIKIVPSGRSFMSVNRNDRVRMIAFPNFTDAQRAIDRITDGDVIHVLGGVLTTRIYAPRDGGEFIVLETTADALTLDLRGFGVDMCEFEEPHFVNLVTSFVVETDEADVDSARAILERAAGL